MAKIVQTFKCPHCDFTMDRRNSPNWTPVPGPGPIDATTLVMSCPNCQKAISTHWAPAP